MDGDGFLIGVALVGDFILLLIAVTLFLCYQEVRTTRETLQQIHEYDRRAEQQQQSMQAVVPTPKRQTMWD